ncbi:hypothetical protein [Mesorhizobium sp.]|uniref:DUF768 domain-containing protein n=1 Tax=Mesorhizobium sp. TaxID=1871066 RepID=UPI000FEA4428|nr:hypothetical protein [Mesorhizobium sp.]RWO57832.1 MAG: DUF768 domain-containing protein [Mesorhizobium sp.]
MSARGITFLHKWIANSVPKTARPDVISINELTHKLFADAKSVGIRREEIDEEVDSLYRTILNAIVHFDPGLDGVSDAGRANHAS